jgi:Sulfotransferase family
MPTAGNERLLFLHVPKTGGSWAGDAMRAAGIELRREGELHDARVSRTGRFAFAFVREPLDWFGSWWLHRRVFGYDAPGEVEHGEPSVMDRFVDLPFPDFVARTAEELPGILSKAYRKYFGPPESPIDFIGRFESLENDLVRALTLSGVEFDEDAVRKMPPNSQSGRHPDCPPEVAAKLVQSERETYERFYPHALRDLTGGVAGAR